MVQRRMKIRFLSLYGAEPLRGRGTRVFEAAKWEIEWFNCGAQGRKREGNILALLHATANDDDKQLVEKHFLTTICHGDVWTEFGILDDTANALMRELNITSDSE
jgi:hypothetical protein